MNKNDAYWDPAVETLSRSELEALQTERLRTTLERALRAPFYREQLGQAGIAPESIAGVHDIRNLPFTTKQDLRDHYPYGFLCTDREQLVRLHVSSGTTGQATAVLYSRGDVDRWADLMARCMYMTGARPGHTFQNLSGYGLFTGGLGFHYGSERIGLLTIPSGPGNSKRQIQIMRDFSTNILHIIPSYALRLVDVMTELGIEPARDLELRIVFMGAEPYSNEVRRRVEDALGVRVFDSYGLSEMNGPGVAFECPFQSGLHIWEDAFLVEIIDPDTLEPVTDGTLGELVLTTLTREAMPMIRYRTKDLTRIIPGNCPCGRTHRRLGRFRGRTDDMFIIKGVNVFPIQVEQVLMAIPEVANNYRIVLRREHNLDDMIVQVEVTDRVFVEDMRHLQRLQKKIARELKDELLITPKVELVQPHNLPRTEGKAVRLVDERDL